MIVKVLAPPRCAATATVPPLIVTVPGVPCTTVLSALVDDTSTL